MVTVNGYVLPLLAAWSAGVLALCGAWAALCGLGRLAGYVRARWRDRGGWDDLSAPPSSHPVWRHPDAQQDWLDQLPAERPAEDLGFSGEFAAMDLAGPGRPAGPPVPYNPRTGLASLLAEFEMREPAWKSEIRHAYAVLGVDDPTLLRGLR